MALLSVLAFGDEVAADRLDFAKDVAPIFIEKCMSCHGDEKQKGGYRLDSPGQVMTAGDSGEPPIVPGNADASLLFELIVSPDEDDRMPQDADPLGGDEMASIARWIEEGASFGGVSKDTSLAEIVVTEYPDAPPHYASPIPVTAITWLNGGNRLAVGGYHEVIVTDVESGAKGRRIGGLPQRLHELIPDADGERLYYVGGQPGRGGEAGVIDLDGNRPRTVMARSRGVFLAADVSADGAFLAVAGADKMIRIIGTDSHTERLRLTQHSDWVTSVAFVPDATHVVSASRDGTARVFDLTSGELVTTFRRHDAPVFGVVALPDGETAVSGGADGSVRVWDLKSGNEKKRVGGFDAGLVKLRLRDERLIASAADGTTSVIRVDGWKRERRLDGTSGAGALAIASETGAVVMGDLEGGVGLWSLEADSEPRLIRLLP